jgi:tetratricopeptide (TPR) repeat protein
MKEAAVMKSTKRIFPIFSTLLCLLVVLPLAVWAAHNNDTRKDDTNALFNTGLALYQNGKFKEAIPPLKRLLDLSPDDEMAMVLLGTINLQIDSLDESEKYYQRALYVNSKNIDALNNLSLVYYKQKRYEAAISELSQSLSVQPNNADTLLTLATIYSEAGKTDDAIATYKRLVQTNPNSEKAYKFLADVYFQKGQYDEVIRLYKNANRSPKTADALTNLGFAYLYKEDLNQAAKYFNASNQINPTKAETHYGLGIINRRQANLDAAIKEFKEATVLNGNYTNAFQELSISFEDKGDYIKALYYAHQVLKDLPDDPAIKSRFQNLKNKAVDYYLRKGSQAYLDNDFAAAVTHWDKVLKLDPDNENAKKFINTAQSKFGKDVKSHNNSAENFFLQNHYQDAFREWDLALKIDPNNQAALEGLRKLKTKKISTNDLITTQGLDYMKRGNVKAALEEFKSTLKVDPKNLVAKQYVDKLQNEQKSESEKYYRKGVELLSQGQVNEAIANLEQALEVAPTDQRTKNLLYKARTMLRDNLKALMARGVELANAGRAAEAKEKFTEVLKLSPGNAEATEYLSKLTGQATHAAVNKDEIKKLYYDGVSLYLDGQNRRAVEVWQKILVLDPDNQEAKSSIAKAEMELKEMEKRGIKVE